VNLDSVEIGVDDLDEAESTYTRLLGVSALRQDDQRRRFEFGRGAIELTPDGGGLRTLRFVTDVPCVTPETFHGLRVEVTMPRATTERFPQRGGVVGIDHVVIHSPDLDRAMSLWRDRLGLRLALDRPFPQRGIRILFFRTGGITLEFVGRLGPTTDASGADVPFGLAYRVTDLAAWRTHLLAAGLDVSEVRAGIKPDTLVATVRSGAAGIPTLLIEANAKSV